MVQVEGPIVQCTGNKSSVDPELVERGQVIVSAYPAGGIDSVPGRLFFQFRETLHIRPLPEPDMCEAHHNYVVGPSFGTNKESCGSEKPLTAKVERKDHFGGPGANVRRAIGRKRLASDHGATQAKMRKRCNRFDVSEPCINPQGKMRVTAAYPAQHLQVMSGSGDCVEVRNIQVVKRIKRE